jgi:multidrug resistance efflux pump
MKRGSIVLIVIVLVVGGLAAGWWWALTSPQQATEFLVDAGLEAGRAESFVASLGGEQETEEEPALRASGSIEGEEVAVVSEFGGRIVGLHAEEGDEVEAGQVLVELDSSMLQAQMAQAEAAIAAAQANLESVKAGTHPAEILAAQAMLHQAIAERDAAESAWQDAQAILDNPQEIEAQITQAQAAVAVAAVQVEQAEAHVAAARVDRDRYRAQGSMEEKWLYRVYDYLVEAALAALEAARSGKEGAEATLAALKALRGNPLALVSQVNLAEGQYDLAEAAVGVAIAKLDELKVGPTPEGVAVAEAQVSQAQAAISGLQAQVDKMTLRSPIAGVITSRSAHAGEAAIAGATLLTVANLDEVTLTIYVPEDELGHVYLGQVVEVEVDSFPDRVFSGTVSYISQRAEFTPKNVQTEKERVNMVFAVKVRLPNLKHLLKPGMPADAILRDNPG